MRISHALVNGCTFEQAYNAILHHALTSADPAYIATADARHMVLLDGD